MGPDTEQIYEQTLVLRSQIGDEAAFEELLGRYGPRIVMFTQRMMQSAPESVADLTQEIWVAIYRSLPSLRDTGKFKPWAFRIARDRIFREYRRRKLAVENYDPELIEEIPAAEEPGSAVEAEELQRCLKLITPEHREALMLRFFENMSYDDIAQATGATIGTVRSRIFYGKRALRETWNREALS